MLKMLPINMGIEIDTQLYFLIPKCNLGLVMTIESSLHICDVLNKNMSKIVKQRSKKV